jgi:hypothetical protein
MNVWQKLVIFLVLILLLVGWSQITYIRMDVRDYSDSPPTNEIKALFNNKEVIRVVDLGNDIFRLRLRWRDNDNVLHFRNARVDGDSQIVVQVWQNY